jgi:hypothetical protein
VHFGQADTFCGSILAGDRPNAVGEKVHLHGGALYAMIRADFLGLHVS